ncbi:MAG: erythronate-4-phosphate dehydrogenase [Lentisphaeria bacterium]|jgi:erythronate-4-phosphate dehydrogenase
MRIVADENIPYVNEFFGTLGDVVLLPGRTISPQDLRGADVLLVRSVTPVNEALLAESTVKFVGTCTIGVDHLDINALQRRKIGYASAPGCNADAVAQYVTSALAHLNKHETPGRAVVVGGGNVGSRVYKALESLGFDCQCVDPYLGNGAPFDLVDFNAVYSADLICLHTPLTRDGLYPTFHMMSESVMARLKSGVVLLNAGRGAVVDNKALLAHLLSGKQIAAVLDVWENEPSISAELLAAVAIGTPHIAGYSFEGRVKGSLMIFDALCRFLKVSDVQRSETITSLSASAFGGNAAITPKCLAEAVLTVYDIGKDHRALLAVAEALPVAFDLLRKNYPKRREFNHYVLTNTAFPEVAALANLGFLQSGLSK